MGGTPSGWTPFADGSGGYTLSQWGPNGSAAYAIAMWTAPDSTQRIVTAGEAGSAPGTLARYNTDGTFDTSFGSGGVTTTGSNGYFKGMAIQPNGKVVGAGVGPGFLAARYNTDGTLDTTFNGTGWVTTAISRNSAGYANAVGLQSTGKIVEGGYYGGPQNNGSVLLRYTSTGQLDSGRGGFGQLAKNGSALGYTTMSMSHLIDGGVQALTIQPDDKIVTVGYAYDANIANGQLTLMRFTANGLPDTTFNGGSPVLLPAGTSGWDKGQAVTLQPVTVNGQTQMDIVVAGDVGTGGSQAGFPTGYLVARFNPNGTLDTSFNNGSGWIRVDPQSGVWNEARGVAIDGSGRIVVGGYWRTGDGTTNGIAAVRLNPNGTLDTSFGNSGIKSEVFTGSPDAQADGLAIGNDGKYYLAGYVQPWSSLLAYFSP
jgi:uncharacterized delta-60 repeat protein